MLNTTTNHNTQFYVCDQPWIFPADVFFVLKADGTAKTAIAGTGTFLHLSVRACTGRGKQASSFAAASVFRLVFGPKASWPSQWPMAKQLFLTSLRPTVTHRYTQTDSSPAEERADIDGASFQNDI